MIFLFDLDGTLLNSTGAILDSMKAALDEENLQVSKEKIKSLIGAPLTTMLSEFGCKDKEQMYRLLSHYKRHYAKVYLEQSSLIPTATEALQLAKSHGQTAIVTTKTGLYSRQLCKHFGIDQYIDALIGGDEVCGLTKPDAAPIYAALSDIEQGINSALISETTQKRANIQTPWWNQPPTLSPQLFSQAVMIGDTLNDTLAAQAAGINAYVTLFEYTPAESFKDDNISILKTPLECVETAIKDRL